MSLAREIAEFILEKWNVFTVGSDPDTITKEEIINLIESILKPKNLEPTIKVIDCDDSGVLTNDSEFTFNHIEDDSYHVLASNSKDALDTTRRIHDDVI